MNFFQKFIDETLRAIGYITRDNYQSLISVKKVREFYEIDSTNYTKVNFYWRCLNYLEENRIITRVGTSVPKRYRVFNFYKFFDLLYHSYLNRVELATSAE